MFINGSITYSDCCIFLQLGVNTFNQIDYCSIFLSQVTCDCIQYFHYCDFTLFSTVLFMPVYCLNFQTYSIKISLLSVAMEKFILQYNKEFKMKSISARHPHCHGCFNEQLYLVAAWKLMH